MGSFFFSLIFWVIFVIQTNRGIIYIFSESCMSRLAHLEIRKYQFYHSERDRVQDSEYSQCACSSILLCKLLVVPDALLEVMMKAKNKSVITLKDLPREYLINKESETIDTS